MTETQSPKNKIGWIRRLKILAVILLIVGIVPWESIFSLDIQSDFIITLNSGGLLWGSLILLQFIYLFEFFIGESIGRIVLLISSILFSSFMLWMSATFNPDVWQDRGIYQNGNNFIIVQFNAFGITGERTVWRLIETQHPDLPIRSIKSIKTGYLRRQLNLPEFGSDYVKPAPALIWDNKRWRLVQFD